ncbi:MAG TPA: hypothetical protein VJN02_00545 [Gammaproteobacteria bacterium]|nr:hypothetical protein [Gammaproteobacteria bacterium]
MPDSNHPVIEESLKTILRESYQPDFKAGQDYLKNKPDGSYVIHPSSDPNALMNISIKMKIGSATEIITHRINDTPGNKAKFSVTNQAVLLRNIAIIVNQIKQDEINKAMKHTQNIKAIQNMAGEHYRSNHLESTEYLRRQDTPVGSFIIRPSSNPTALMTIDIKVHEHKSIQSHRIEGTPENRKKFLTDKQTLQSEIGSIVSQELSKQVKQTQEQSEERTQLKKEFVRVEDRLASLAAMHEQKSPGKKTALQGVRDAFKEYHTQIHNPNSTNDAIKQAAQALRNKVASLKDISKQEKEAKHAWGSKILTAAEKTHELLLRSTANNKEKKSAKQEHRSRPGHP